MLKLAPKANLKSLFLTGAATTATLLSPSMIKDASAISSCADNPGDVTSSTPLASPSLGCQDVSGGPGGNPDVSGGVLDINDWSLIAKVDKSNGFNFNGLTVTDLNESPVIDGETKAGKWTFTNSDSSFPLMIALKGGDQSIAYLIKEGSTSGTWDMGDLENNGGKTPGLSNFSVYQAVPEPLTLLGATSAIGFGAAFKKRLEKKRRDQDQA